MSTGTGRYPQTGAQDAPVTAVARQTVRQPEVGTMQNKGQTLGMRHFNALYADKQLIQRR